MKIDFAILGKENEVSGGHIYNRAIARDNDSVQLCYEQELTDFKACLQDSHDALLIDAWGLHNLEPGDVNQKHYLLVHHPLALDASLNGNEEKEIEFWNKAEGIVVTGQEVAEFVQSKTNTPVILIEPGFFKKSIRSENNNNDDFQILGIGSFIPRKGDELLLASCENLKFPFVLNRLGPVVDHAYFKKLRSLVANGTHSNDINLVGEVDEKEKHDFMNSASLAVFPTTYESYGMAIQECLSHQIPVLTNDVLGMKNRFGVKGIRYIDNSVAAWSLVLNEMASRGKAYQGLKLEAKNNNLSFLSWETQSKKMSTFVK
ncbi:MAG: glycosyltransferase involved in cell wall biosynthesis [Glaciecola sp.]|jgi:glycosyltransferase involved in cell wall biosynthesis